MSESDQSKPRPWVLILAIAITLVAVAAAVQLTQKPAQTADCTPEGGLRCADATIHICNSGLTSIAGECPGGCSDVDGIARCTASNGTLLAPVGAMCRAGMAFCALGEESLLICRDGKLAKGADCPGGCLEHGENGGLYCLDESENIRFAVGFPCPQFPGSLARYTCGADGKQVLRCTDGLLAKHSVRCPRCTQLRTGQLSCVDEEGKALDPETGQPMVTASAILEGR